MGKQIRNIIGYGMVAVLLLVCVFFYRQAFLVVLFCLMLLLPPVSYVFCRRAFRDLSLQVRFSAREAEKHLPVKLILKFCNLSHIPLLHVECRFCISSPYYGSGEEYTYVLPAPTGEHELLTLPVEFSYCGMFQVDQVSYRAYDYLHFFSFTKQANPHARIHIFPTTKRKVSYHPSLYAEGFDEYEAFSGTGNVSSNVTDVREYQPGDRLQKIHWKLSAKIDKLMVKENEATSSHQFYVLVELYKPAGHSEYLDHAVENAYGVSRELLEAKETFFFAFYSTGRREFTSFPIRNEGELLSALGEAYFELPYETENLAALVYQNSGMQKGTLIQVTHEGVMDEFQN